jgi:hypothetical protein
MKKTLHKQPRKPCIISYDNAQHGWIIQSQFKPIFANREDIENYCRKKLGRLPILDPALKEHAGRTYYQQLPESSVWTGAPWDRSFAKKH